MKAFSAIAEGFSRWIDLVAGVIAAWLGRLDAPRAVTLVEDEGGGFVLQAGEPTADPDATYNGLTMTEDQLVAATPTDKANELSGARVDLILRPDRFLFRPLELPSRAAEFLDGIVCAQIDRLTPWSGAEAAFGWSRSVEEGTDRMIVTIAATARAVVMPYVRAIANAGAHSIAVFTLLPEPTSGAGPIKVWEERLAGLSEAIRIRRVLVRILTVAVVAGATAVGAFPIIDAHLQAQQGDIARQIADIRATSLSAREAASGTPAAAQRAVERRKQESPSSVIVLDTLSQILPDHTYVSELRIEGNKLRLVGVTRNAPSLIEIIERSARFTQATFFAPTTRSPSEPGERFHLEAVIQPLGPPRS